MRLVKAEGESYSVHEETRRLGTIFKSRGRWFWSAEVPYLNQEQLTEILALFTTLHGE